jgi:hypothetical protein
LDAPFSTASGEIVSVTDLGLVPRILDDLYFGQNFFSHYYTYNQFNFNGKKKSIKIKEETKNGQIRVIEERLSLNGIDISECHHPSRSSPVTEHRPGTFAKKKFFRSVPASDLLPILGMLRILLVVWVKTSVKSKKKRKKYIEKGP